MSSTKAKPLESADSPKSPDPGDRLPAWIKVGAIAAASALAGGLAAAWHYRKTLHALQQAEADGGISNPRIADEGIEHDT